MSGLPAFWDQECDLLYISLEDSPGQVVNKRVDADVVLDLAEDNRIVGIEILDASKRIRLEKLLPLEYQETA